VPGSGVPHCLHFSPDMPRTADSIACFISAAERKRLSRFLSSARKQTSSSARGIDKSGRRCAGGCG